MTARSNAIVITATLTAFLFMPVATVGAIWYWETYVHPTVGWVEEAVYAAASYIPACAMAVLAVLYAREPGRRTSVVAGIVAVAAGMAVSNITGWNPLSHHLPIGIMESMVLLLGGGSVIAFHGYGIKRHHRIWIGAGLLGGGSGMITAPHMLGDYHALMFIGHILLIAGGLVTGLAIMGFGSDRWVVLVPAVLAGWYASFMIILFAGSGLH